MVKPPYGEGRMKQQCPGAVGERVEAGTAPQGQAVDEGARTVPVVRLAVQKGLSQAVEPSLVNGSILTLDGGFHRVKPGRALPLRVRPCGARSDLPANARCPRG